MKRKAQAIANQKPALSQFLICKASSVATPKKSTNMVKLVPNLIFLISASLHHLNSKSNDAFEREQPLCRVYNPREPIGPLRAFALQLVNFSQFLSSPELLTASFSANSQRCPGTNVAGEAARRSVGPNPKTK